MRANPGGQLDPSEVVGRDGLIRRLWRVLDRQSLVLTAERRMGKTSIIKKMNAEAPDGVLTVFHDIEGLRSPLEFAKLVFEDVEEYLSRRQRVCEKARSFLGEISGGSVGGILTFPQIDASHWKKLLVTTIEDLVEHQDKILIFFWDEVPLMLYEIKQQSGEAVAMELLDTLRSLRQMNPKLRMVFTGSIGLHNVILSLRRAGHPNSPINDMLSVEVPPLESEDARHLAALLLKGERIETQNPEAVCAALVNQADCIPYFIHHLVDRMTGREGDLTADTVREIMTSFLTDPIDPWHLRHYRERVDIYYDASVRPVVLGLLDVLSTAASALPFPEVFNLLKTQIAMEDREAVLEALGSLQTDHYVVQETGGEYRFRYPLVQRWWRLHRGLS